MTTARVWREVYQGGSPATERRAFETLARTIVAVQDRTQRLSGASAALRAFHAKSILGVDNATLRFRHDLPAELHAGFAQSGRVYPTAVRFSNANGAKHGDDEPDMRGVALRVTVSDTEVHDLLMTNYPVSYARNAEQFVAFAEALTGSGLGRILGLVKLALKFGPGETIRMVRNVQAGRQRMVESLVLETFWSRGAIRWGDRLAVRYLLRPGAGAAPLPHDGERGAGYLREDLGRRLRDGDVTFELFVQPFVDEKTTPIEDTAVEWREADSAPLPVATLTIPAQDIERPEARATEATIDGSAFNPWRTTDEFRPLGNLNRARNLVYAASSEHRRANHTNPAPLEPAGG